MYADAGFQCVTTLEPWRRVTRADIHGWTGCQNVTAFLELYRLNLLPDRPAGFILS